VLSHPHQQSDGEDGDALSEAGGECFLMAGKFNRKYSSTSGSTENSRSDLFLVTTNRSLAFIQEWGISFEVQQGLH
jgi:hypothetical protein